MRSASSTARSPRPAAERIKVAQYLLLDSEEAIKKLLAAIRAAYDEAHDPGDATTD